MNICDHAGWGRYPEERGAQPAPTEMIKVCQHGIECPVCKFRVLMNCDCEPHSAPPLSYRIAVNGPAEVR